MSAPAQKQTNRKKRMPRKKKAAPKPAPSALPKKIAQPVRKRQVIGESGKKQKVVKASNTVIVPNQSSLYQSQVIVKAGWNPKAVLEMQAAMTSYFLTRSIAASPLWQTSMIEFYDGMYTQWTRFCTLAAGEPALDKRLQIIHDLAAGFQSKTVTTNTYGKISYAWDNIVPPGSGQYPTGWNNWDFVVTDPDDLTALAPAHVHIPAASDAAYSAYMNQIQAISAANAVMLKTVDSNQKSVLSGDPSAYAKVYAYAGLNPSGAGAWYNSCENEVEIRAPTLAHNVVYPIGQQDDRVAQKLITNEGGPAHNLAPLLPCFTSWFNKKRTEVKFLDLYEVVYTLIYWYLKAVELAVLDGKDVSQYQLPMSQQDFVIVVRQCILSTFKEQWMVQFTGPLSYDSGGATNFLPLQILGNCYGNDQFKRMLGPPLLAENLSMLGAMAFKYNGQASEINQTTCVPCWGFYNDIPAQFTIGEKIPLFAVDPASQKAINMVDCTYGSNNYVNVNGSYYLGALGRWNNAVTKLKTYLNVTDLANISPPHNAAFLQMTRVFGYTTVPQQEAILAGRKLDFPSLYPISNLPGGKLSGKEAGTNRKSLPTLPPPTNVANITIIDQYATYFPTKELHEFSDYLIIPTIRLDPSSINDLLNKTMYQTITHESLSQYQDGISAAPGYLQRMSEAGNMGVEGQGKISSSSITTVLNTLTSRGDGGVLAGLLGGFAKQLIPEAGGLIDSIATALPF